MTTNRYLVSVSFYYNDDASENEKDTSRTYEVEARDTDQAATKAYDLALASGQIDLSFTAVGSSVQRIAGLF